MAIAARSIYHFERFRLFDMNTGTHCRSAAIVRDGYLEVFSMPVVTMRELSQLDSNERCGETAKSFHEKAGP